MYEFVAIGPGTKQRWNRPITPNEVVLLGRSPTWGWAVPWDMRISREHAELVLKNDRLHVRRLESARNSIYLGDSARDTFTVGPGEEFRIGKTVFRLATQTYQPEGSEVAGKPKDGAPPLTEVAKQSELERLQAVLARLDDEETSGEAGPSEPPARDLDRPSTRSFATDATSFSDYELVDQLHRSDTTQVLKARHRYLQRWAAIHILTSARATDELIARFRRKARLVAHFDQENIVRAFDAGEIEGTHFLVTEFVDGWTLDTAVTNRELDSARVLSYVIQVAQGLAYAHARKVVHRNIHPGHVLVARDGGVKLVGWGGAWCSSDWSLTEYEGAGHVVGTPEFLSPEQLADSRDVDERSDIYSLGRTLFAALNTVAVARGVAADQQHGGHTLAELGLELPAGLDETYRRMVAEDRSQRFPSMNEVRQAFGALLS